MDPNQPPMNIHQPYSAQINPANPSSAALPTAPPASTTQVINPFATSPVRPPPSAASVPYPSYSSSQIKNPFSGTNPSAPAPAPALASAPAAASHKVNLATVLNAGPMPTSIGASSATQAMADFMKRRLQNANDGAQAQGQAQGQAQVQAQAQAGTLNLNPGTGGQAQVLNSNHNNNFSSAKPSTAGIVDLTSSRDEPSPVPHLNVPVTIPPTAPTQNQTSDQTAVVKIDSAAPAPVTNPPTSSLASNQTNLINFMHHIMKQQQGEGGGGGGGGGSGNPLSASLLGAAGVTQSSKEQSARIMQDMQKVIQERLKQHQMKLGGGQVANKPTAHGSGLAATPAGNNQMGGVGALKPAVASFVTRPPQLPAPGGGGAQKSKKKASELSDDSDGFGSSGLKKKKKKVASSNNLNFMDGLGGPKTNMTYNYTAEELGSVISSIKRGPGRPRKNELIFGVPPLGVPLMGSPPLNSNTNNIINTNTNTNTNVINNVMARGTSLPGGAAAIVRAHPPAFSPNNQGQGQGQGHAPPLGPPQQDKDEAALRKAAAVGGRGQPPFGGTHRALDDINEVLSNPACSKGQAPEMLVRSHALLQRLADPDDVGGPGGSRYAAAALSAAAAGDLIMGSSALAPDWSLQDPVAYRALYYAISVAVETHDWKALRWATDKLDEIEKEGRAVQCLLEVVASAADKVASMPPQPPPPPPALPAGKPPLPLLPDAPAEPGSGSAALVMAAAKDDDENIEVSPSAVAVEASAEMPVQNVGSALAKADHEDPGQESRESFMDLLSD